MKEGVLTEQFSAFQDALFQYAESAKKLRESRNLFEKAQIDLQENRIMFATSLKTAAEFSNKSEDDLMQELSKWYAENPSS